MYVDDAPELFYSFDDGRREVCFRRFDMPTPWMNYLSNGTFTTMISGTERKSGVPPVSRWQ